MPHSYSNLLTHVVFSTKNRQPTIDEELKNRLYPYMGGVVRNLDGYTRNGRTENNLRGRPGMLHSL